MDALAQPRLRYRSSISSATSWKELADGYQQTGERQHNEHDLVDVVFARRQSTRKVHSPERRIKPEREPGPLFPATKRDHGDQQAEQAQADRGQPSARMSG